MLTVVISYDDPECGGAADALVDQLQREAAALSQRVPTAAPLNVRPLAVLQGGSHRDALHGTLQDLFLVRPEDVFVIVLLKGNNPDEFKKVKELCLANKGKHVQNNVVTHLSSYSDVGLIVRNFVRCVLDMMLREAQ